MSLGEIEPPIEFEPDSFDPQIALNAEVLDRIAAALCLRLRPWLLSITNKEVEMAGKPTLRLPLIALPILLLTALPGWLANSALDAPASVSETSPLGNYLIESVPLTGLLAPGNGLAYLRIIDRQLPERVYRSPLYAVQSVDMRVIGRSAVSPESAQLRRAEPSAAPHSEIRPKT